MLLTPNSQNYTGGIQPTLCDSLRDNRQSTYRWTTEI